MLLTFTTFSLLIVIYVLALWKLIYYFSDLSIICHLICLVFMAHIVGYSRKTPQKYAIGAVSDIYMVTK